MFDGKWQKMMGDLGYRLATEMKGFELIIVALRLAVARNSPLDCCI